LIIHDLAPFSTSRFRRCGAPPKPVFTASLKEMFLPNLNVSPIPPLDQAQTPIVDALQQLATHPHARFYAPGHGGGRGAPAKLRSLLNSLALAADLPELPVFDSLLAPTGMIQTAQQLAAASVGAEQTWFLTNGSTAGIIAAILATAQEGQPLVVPRNCHRSVVNGLVLSGAMPVYLTPQTDPTLGLWDGLSPALLQRALLEYPDTTAVLVVSPTYEGICADIPALAAIAHAANLPLIVDQAHGAHLGCHPALPAHAIAQGADLVIESTHKTQGALSQGAMLHLQGNRVDRDRLTQAIALVQTTSPNALILASLDAARQQRACQGEQIWGEIIAIAAATRARLAAIPGLTPLGPEGYLPPDIAFDPTRLTLRCDPPFPSGYALDDWLYQQHQICAELPGPNHLTFILGPGSDRQSCDRLCAVLENAFSSPCAPPAAIVLEGNAGAVGPNTPAVGRLNSRTPGLITAPPFTPRQVFAAPRESVPLMAAAHRICAELVCPYPPGIPVLFPGEILQPTTLTHLKQLQQMGSLMTGCQDPDLQNLQVVCLEAVSQRG
jgi:arginine decarboxylase